MDKRPNRKDAVSLVVFCSPLPGEHDHQVILMHPKAAMHGLRDILPGGCIRGKESDYVDAVVRHLVKKTGMNIPYDSITKLAYEIPTKREGGVHFFFACVTRNRMLFSKGKYPGDRIPYWVSVRQVASSFDIEPSHQTAVLRAYEHYKSLLEKVVQQSSRTHKAHQALTAAHH